jgi:hypothetical protein
MIEMKRIVISLAASGESRQVDVEPGDTVRQVLERAKLPGYVLAMEETKRRFLPEQKLFPLVKHNTEVKAHLPIEVGSLGPTSILLLGGLLLGLAIVIGVILSKGLKQKDTAESKKQAANYTKEQAEKKLERKTEVGTRVKQVPFRTEQARERRVSNSRATGRRQSGCIIEIDGRPYWKRACWKKSRNVYTGFYRSLNHVCEGRIIESGRNSLKFFIKEPPAGLLLHSKYSGCLMRVDGSEHTYLLHFCVKPKSIGDGILYIESILGEC